LFHRQNRKIEAVSWFAHVPTFQNCLVNNIINVVSLKLFCLFLFESIQDDYLHVSDTADISDRQFSRLVTRIHNSSSIQALKLISIKITIKPQSL